ncbi:protein O-mannosyl-transferase family [Aurantibacter sp.]|uniref:protein O-mannosyl-transferase family n=1 Tax=Aurantibacter sp. TaxID=2807103 RepID=UPI0035C8454A
MSSKVFNKFNQIIGWLAFLIAAIVFGLTVEPTVSFWDAGEYILTSSKLQVGHPPGAPLYQMLGAVFSIFALKANQIGFIMNMMSAISSAFVVLFMFWSIVLLIFKIKSFKEGSISKNQTIMTLGSAFIGALAFGFTDTFWFNASETEVYAMATFVMSLMFYLGLRWDKDMEKDRGNKWLILIAFVIGLSFGIHFMGLLTIPAIGLIYYFKNYKTITVKNFIIANLVSVAILLFIFKLMFPNVLRYFSMLELFFVNQIGLPFNSGSIIAAILLITSFYYGLKYTKEKGLIHYNTGILCLLFIILGSSTWLMLPIRANANVVINENNPSSARELLAYYNLEQYPETHLFYGPLFTDQFSGLDENQPYVDDKPKYEKDKKTGTYIIVNDWKESKQNYNSDHASILPRMWSGENAENYMLFTGYLDFKLKPEYQMENELRKSVAAFKNDIVKGNIDYEDYINTLKQFSQFVDVEKPSLAQNIAYMFEYQLGYMYWRYFMWNFTGRQDDIQGRYDNHGNWISGIDFIDAFHLGQSQDHLPSDVKNNKARNTYYFLPFILGLIGFFFVLNKDKKLFWVMLVFFLFTGLAIQVYTNVRPFEPRERDYSVVGSFYVFALWIGIGVYAIYDFLKKYVSKQILAPLVPIVCFLLVPTILISNNWNDHDRSGKYTALAMAKKYLGSCEKNAILFSIGDNDTFALWYAQEIEGYRTDVRVVNTSLFQTDWYIDQMKRKAYESDPIPSSLTHDKYKHGTRDYIMKRERSKDTLMISDFMSFITSDNPKTKLEFALIQEGDDPSGYPSQYLKSNYFPTENIRIPVNKSEVIKSGVVKPKDADKILPFLDVRIKDNAIYKNRLLMLDIVANNNWERPIYFTGGAFSDEDYIWMKDFLQLDGMVYKLVPIKSPVDRANPFDMGRVDSELMYNMVKSWDWGNSGSKDIYHDTETRRNSITYRGNLARLIEALINEDQPKKAEEITDIAMANMPVDQFGYYTLLEPYINAYYEVEAKEKAQQLFKDVSVKYQENLKYYSELTIENQEKNFTEILTDIERYKALIEVLIEYDEDFAQKESLIFNNYLGLFKHFYQGDEEPETEIRDERDIETTNDTFSGIKP